MSLDYTESDLLGDLLSLLRSRLSIDAHQSWIAVYAGPPILPAGGLVGEFTYILSPGESSFDAGMFDGGGTNQLMDDMQVGVTVVTRVHLDPTNTDAELLASSARGMLEGKRRALYALAGQGLTGSPLRELIRPVGSTRPEVGRLDGEGDDSLPIAWQTVLFSVPFDWDVSSL